MKQLELDCMSAAVEAEGAWWVCVWVHLLLRVEDALPACRAVLIAPLGCWHRAYCHPSPTSCPPCVPAAAALLVKRHEEAEWQARVDSVTAGDLPAYQEVGGRLWVLLGRCGMR